MHLIKKLSKNKKLKNKQTLITVTQKRDLHNFFTFEISPRIYLIFRRIY